MPEVTCVPQPWLRVHMVKDLLGTGVVNRRDTGDVTTQNNFMFGHFLPVSLLAAAASSALFVQK